MTKPWLAGPRELLAHAASHIQREAPNAFDHRIAFISIDNAVELTIKTYLGLPKRARGSDGPSRRQLSEASNSFPDLLDLLEKFGGDRLDGVSLADVEWYHRIRNTLYHEGNGITVDPSQVDAYLQIARILVAQLLDPESEDGADVKTEPQTVVGSFIVHWSFLEHNLRLVVEAIMTRPAYLFRQAIAALVEQMLISEDEGRELIGLLELRNKTVHQPDHVDQDEVSSAIDRVRFFGNRLAEIHEALSRDEDGESNE